MKLIDLIQNKMDAKNKAAKRSAAKKVAVGTGIGVGMGLLAGLLMAPKTGKQTREDIATTSKKATDSFNNSVKGIVEKIQEIHKNGVCCRKNKSSKNKETDFTETGNEKTDISENTENN